jgi:alcohol dehydrogenase class IV
MKQILYIGQFAIQYLESIFQEYHIKTVFLVRGNKSYKQSGAESDIEQIVSKKGIRLVHFYDFEENPKLEDVLSGLKLLESIKIDMMLAVGGGSVLDMAKLIRFYYSFSGDFEHGIYERKRNSIPLAAVPTTAGTGCETTHFAVLYKDKVKYSIAHETIMPDIAIVDPIYTYNNSPYLTACTGFDALAQAIEAFWNVNATQESDTYAIRAIELLWPNLPLAVNSPTTDARDKMSEGAYWAGRAINITKTTAPHAFSYPFTTYYGLPHGHAVALTFPALFEINICFEKHKLNTSVDAELYKKKNNELLELLQLSNDKCTLKNDMQTYLSHLGINQRIDFDRKLICNNVNNARLHNNPVLITDAIVDLILNSIEQNSCV